MQGAGDSTSTAEQAAVASGPAGTALELHPEVRAFFLQYYSEERLERLLKMLAVPPAHTTIRTNTLRTTREELIARLNEHLAATEFRAQPHPVLSDMIVIPSGSSQRPSRSYPEVVVTRKTGEALMRGAELYAPGVLAAERNISAGDTVSVCVDVKMRSLRGAIVDRGYGDIFLGNGIAEMSRSEIFRATSGCAVRFTERVHNAPGMNGVLEGLMYLQNLPSAVVAHVLNPQPGERILDACAAPGGKTTHIAQLMGDKGVVYALDRTKSKADVIAGTAASLGIKCIRALRLDATKASRKRTPAEEAALPREGPEAEGHDYGRTGFPDEWFDRVLLDPPCSALAALVDLAKARFRMNSPLTWTLDEDITPAELRKHAEYQRALLWAAVRVLKVGGTLVFSTCTISPLENEMMVRHALDTFPLRLEPAEPRVGGPALPNAGLSEEEARLVQRFDPSDGSGSDLPGFFLARFTKTGPCAPP
eukprot:tig00000786_g4052.t1